MYRLNTYEALEVNAEGSWIENNGFVERSNSTYREDVLDAYLFNSLDEARRITVDWLEEYNSIYLHAALGNKIPCEYSSNLESVYL